MALERPRFSTTKFSEGYDMGEVDDAIDRIFAALAEASPPMGPADVAGLRFTPVRLREGYAIDEVDSWLDLAAAELARRGTGPTAPEDDVRATAVPETRSAAITEVKPNSSRALLVLGVMVVLGVLAYALFA